MLAQPRLVEQVKHIVGFSGGIDSQACARWVLDRFAPEDVFLLNSDAGGNEHWITTEFVAEYSRTIHPVIALKPLVLDMWKTDGWAEEKRGLDGNAPLTFDLMAEIKGRFPSKTAQFCTDFLKIRPMVRWIKENLGDEEYTRYSGVRRDESRDRADQPELGWDTLLDCAYHCPLVEWPKQRCFDSVATEPINPLYSLGFDRVGCAPCVNAGKEDIRAWAYRAPEMVDKVRAWEQRLQRTFFAPCVPGMRPRIDGRGKLTIHNWIDEVVEWAATDRGGRQFNILRNLDRPSCESKFGLCE